MKDKPRLRDELEKAGLFKEVADMNLFDAPLACAVFSKKEPTQELLQALLRKDDLIVNKIESDFKRTDYGFELMFFIDAVDSSNKKYDIVLLRDLEEIQPQRAFEYSDLLLERALEREDDPDNLPESHVIIVCEKDPFGQGRLIYEAAGMQTEDGYISFGDDRNITYFNTEYNEDTRLS